jgi:hypothetical protein
MRIFGPKKSNKGRVLPATRRTTMAMTGSTKAEEYPLPESATITIRNQEPHPCGEVEVTPNGGRVHFQNEDDREYRLRFWKAETKETEGIDVLLPAGARVTVVINKDDVFSYSVQDMEKVASGKGGGPIKN